MSIIAVRQIHFRCTLPQLVQSLVNKINGHFEALNFVVKGKYSHKTCYIRLSEKLDPLQVVEKINTQTKYQAFIPKEVPDLPLAAPKRGKIPAKTLATMRLKPSLKKDQVVTLTHKEILVELQSKYTGLYNLSKKTGHKLMAAISKIVQDRIQQIIDKNSEAAVSGFVLSQTYRKLHPHFGDFQLILSTLHKLQDAAGAARAQIQESELCAVTTQPYVIDNLPYDKVQKVCNKYSEKINKKLLDHIRSLQSEIVQTDTEEDIARKKVREELKKLAPYIPLITKQVISNHFVPQKSPFHRFRVYGEPFLPGKEQLMPFLKRYRAVHAVRSERMYNMLRFNVPLSQYGALMAMDGTVVGGAKLVIRSSDIPLYQHPDFKPAGMEHTEPEDMELDGEEMEDWSEEVAA